MRHPKVFANEDMIIFQTDYEKFVPYKGIQVIELDNTYGYEQITNKTVCAILAKEHNDAIMKLILKDAKNSIDQESLYKEFSKGKKLDNMPLYELLVDL